MDYNKELGESIFSFDCKRNEADITVFDINKDTFNSFSKKLSDYMTNPKYSSLDEKELLDKLGMISDINGIKYLTNAGVLLFTNASKISRVYPRFHLDYKECTISPTKVDYRYDSDDLNNTGNLIEFYNVVLNRLKIGMPNPFRLDGAVNSGDNDFISVIREAIVNAFSNCDYTIGGITIVKYADRIVFTYTGKGLNRTLTPITATPTNVQISRTLRITGFAEKHESNIQKIFDTCSKMHLPEPILVEDYNSCTVLSIFTMATAINTTEFDSEVLYLVAGSNTGISRKELLEKLGCSSTTLYRSLKKLLASGNVITNNLSTNKLRYYPNI